MAVAACGGQGTGVQQGRLRATDSAARFGVAEYAVDERGATVFDAEGAELGHLTVSAPTATTRQVVLALPDGTQAVADIDRPAGDGRFTVAYPGKSLFEGVQTDAALAPMFAASKLTFRRTEPANSAQLRGQDFATCVHANTSAGCYDLTAYSQYYCVYSQYTQQEDWGEYETYDEAQAACNSMCPGYGDAAPAGGLFFCWCTVTHTEYNNYVSCPRVSCGTVGQRDLVDRDRYCADPGSCSTLSYYTGCTTL